MTHCTVCGAEAREGAKFCTSCGARLVDTVASAPEPAETATVAAVEPDEIDVPAEPDADQPDPESTWAPAASDTAAGEVETMPAEPVEPESEAIEPAEPPASLEYTASWPYPEEEAAAKQADEDSGSEPPAQPEVAWSSWADVTVEEPLDQPESPPAAPDAAEPAPEDPMDASHHGASAWESWAPSASEEATVAAASGDVGATVRRLLDDLADRIDRLIDPAPIAARGVDADELADQLDRWSRASTDAAGLLEVVQAVRKSPRDVDALTRLADRAPDLELLVRHYQAITSGAGDWAWKLRDRQSTGEDDG